MTSQLLLRRRSLKYHVLGSTLEICAAGDTSEFIDEHLGDLPPASSHPPDERWSITRRGRRWRLRTEDQPPITADPDVIVPELLRALNRLAVRGMHNGVALHGAAIESGDGVIVVLGASGAGKSTIAAASTRGGFGFVAEEIVAIESTTLSVQPFHRPIGIRPESPVAAALRDDPIWSHHYGIIRPVKASTIGRLAEGGLIRAVVLIKRRADRPELQYLRPSTALVEISRHTFAGPIGPVEAFRVAERIARSAPTAQMSYRDQEEAFELLSQLVR